MGRRGCPGTASHPPSRGARLLRRSAPGGGCAPGGPASPPVGAESAWDAPRRGEGRCVRTRLRPGDRGCVLGRGRCAPEIGGCPGDGRLPRVQGCAGGREAAPGDGRRCPWGDVAPGMGRCAVGRQAAPGMRLGPGRGGCLVRRGRCAPGVETALGTRLRPGRSCVSSRGRSVRAGCSEPRAARGWEFLRVPGVCSDREQSGAVGGPR